LKNIIYILGVAIFVAACGGGGGGGPAPAPAPAPTPAPTPAPIPEIDKPIFISLPSVINVEENKKNVFQIKALDNQNDQIQFALSGADSSEFNLSQNGLISFKEAKDFESSEVNLYNLIVTISDGSNQSSRNIVVILKNVEEGQASEGQIDKVIAE
tara:strand:- start:1330 stop:1797 length:468 start_codon:yes stop_codon:yes gene_type:complete